MKRFNPVVMAPPEKEGPHDNRPQTTPEGLQDPRPQTSDPVSPVVSRPVVRDAVAEYAGGPGVRLGKNDVKHFWEIFFPAKPCEALRKELKAARWRYWGPTRAWYHKQTEENRAWAEEFIGRIQNSEVRSQKPEAKPEEAGMAARAPLPTAAELAESGWRPVQPAALHGLAALKSLKEFIGPAQTQVLREMVRDSEEREFFRQMLRGLAERVATMPKTYEQDGKGGRAVVYLHYFTSGCDWHITEKDRGENSEARSQEPEDMGQHQAFGQANLGYGPELGYISIVELLANGAELDLYWKPKTLDEVNGKGQETEVENSETEVKNSESRIQNPKLPGPNWRNRINRR